MGSISQLIEISPTNFSNGLFYTYDDGVIGWAGTSFSASISGVKYVDYVKSHSQWRPPARGRLENYLEFVVLSAVVVESIAVFFRFSSGISPEQIPGRLLWACMRPAAPSEGDWFYSFSIPRTLYDTSKTLYMWKNVLNRVGDLKEEAFIIVKLSIWAYVTMNFVHCGICHFCDVFRKHVYSVRWVLFESSQVFTVREMSILTPLAKTICTLWQESNLTGFKQKLFQGSTLPSV